MTKANVRKDQRAAEPLSVGCAKRASAYLGSLKNPPQLGCDRDGPNHLRSINVKTLQIAALVGIFASQTVVASAATTTPTVRDERQMTQLGTQLLGDVDRADRALQKRDDAEANGDIDDASAARMKLAQDAKADGGSMIVPLYADLDDTEYLSRIGKNRTASQPLTVTSNVGQFTYLAIDLDKTNSRLNAAKVAIRDKNDQAAEDSLSAIGSNLVALSVSTDLPLLTAREDLALAQTALNDKNTQAVAADLHQASQALRVYAVSGPHAADAKALSGEIDTVAANSSGPNMSMQTVDSWWERVKDWFAHPSM
jgi:hypothetical protein